MLLDTIVIKTVSFLLLNNTFKVATMKFTPLLSLLFFLAGYQAVGQTAMELFELGNALAVEQEYEKAVIHFDKAIQSDTTFEEAIINRGLAKSELFEFKQAIIDFDKAILLNPNNGHTYYYRGNCNSNLKNIKDAIKDYDKAIIINQ